VALQRLLCSGCQLLLKALSGLMKFALEGENSLQKEDVDSLRWIEKKLIMDGEKAKKQSVPTFIRPPIFEKSAAGVWRLNVLKKKRKKEMNPLIENKLAGLQFECIFTHKINRFFN
jgi:hypothetical protein